MPDVPALVREALSEHPVAKEVRLIGSRLDGCPSSLSDWDFEIETADPVAVARDLPDLMACLNPIVAQWDRLAYRACYMLLLRGPMKVDLMLDLDRPKEPPWVMSKETLRGIDDHFWDWILWLASKDEKKQIDKVREQLALMHRHLLAPMAVPLAPGSVADAVRLYLAARERLCSELDVVISRAAQREVLSALLRAGYDVKVNDA
jgi:hypothetical protein